MILLEPIPPVRFFVARRPGGMSSKYEGNGHPGPTAAQAIALAREDVRQYIADFDDEEWRDAFGTEGTPEQRAEEAREEEEKWVGACVIEIAVPDEWEAIRVLSSMTLDSHAEAARKWRAAFPVPEGATDPLDECFRRMGDERREWKKRAAEWRAKDDEKLAAETARCEPTAVVLWRYLGQTVGVGDSIQSARRECARHLRHDHGTDDTRPLDLGEPLVVDRGSAESTFDAVMNDLASDPWWASSVQHHLNWKPASQKQEEALGALQLFVELGVRASLEEGAAEDEIECAIRAGRDTARAPRVRGGRRTPPAYRHADEPGVAAK